MSDLKKSRVVFQLPNVGSWFENVAVRPSGALLATRVDAPEVLEVDPATGASKSVARLPAPFTSLTGIAELAPDVFALGAGQYDLSTGGTVPGSWEIWLLDLSSSSSTTPPEAKFVAKIPTAGLVNGLAAYDADTVLAADSEFGALYRVDVPKGEHALLADDVEAMTTPPESPLKIGINGVKVHGGDQHLYFTNSMRGGGTLYRVPLAPKAAGLAGPAETVAESLGGADDFVLDAAGETAYVTTHPANTVVRVPLKGTGAGDGGPAVATIAGHPETLEVGGCTAVAFGRGAADSNVLYVVTSGAVAVPVKGELVEPAKIVAVDLA